MGDNAKLLGDLRRKLEEVGKEDPTTNGEAHIEEICSAVGKVLQERDDAVLAATKAIEERDKWHARCLETIAAMGPPGVLGYFVSEGDAPKPFPTSTGKRRRSPRHG